MGEIPNKSESVSAQRTEYPPRVLKPQTGHTKEHCRGLPKNLAQVHIAVPTLQSWGDSPQSFAGIAAWVRMQLQPGEVPLFKTRHALNSSSFLVPNLVHRVNQALRPS